MSWIRPLLLVIAIGLAGLIGFRFYENGGFSAPIQSRVNKLERGNRDAIRALEAKLDPRSQSDWVNLGQIYTTYALMPEAEYCFQRAVALGSLSLEQQFKYGICLSRRGKLEKAIAVLLPVSKSNNELAVHANLQIGFDYLRLNKRDEARAALNNARTDGIAKLSLARILIREDRVTEAIEVLDGLIQTNPNSMRAHQMRSWAFEILGDEQEARISYDLSMHTSGMVMIHPLSRSWDEETVGRMGAAQHLTASSVALQQHEYDRAIKEGELALELIAPLWRPGYGIQMIQSHMANENPTEALAYLAKWLVHDGESAQLWELAGDAFLARGDAGQAEAAWLRGAQVRASRSVTANAEACRKLADLYATQGKTDLAVLYTGWHQFESGRLQWRDNHIREAIVLFTQASVQLPDEDRVWFYLAEAHRAMNDRAAAREAYQKCLAIDENHGRARVGLELSQ